MGKLKFKTVGQFLVALEESPLYCNKNCKFVLDDSMEEIHIESILSSKVEHYSTLGYIKSFVEEREFTRNPPPQDKDLVWCWLDSALVGRNVRFYDKNNDSVFNTGGLRSCTKYDYNYEVIPKNPETGLWDAPFDWANEAVKHLED